MRSKTSQVKVSAWSNHNRKKSLMKKNEGRKHSTEENLEDAIFKADKKKLSLEIKKNNVVRAEGKRQSKHRPQECWKPLA